MIASHQMTIYQPVKNVDAIGLRIWSSENLHLQLTRSASIRVRRSTCG